MADEIELIQVRAVLDVLNCGAMLLHRGGMLMHVNEPFANMTQRTVNELVGCDVKSLDNTPFAEAYFKKVFARFDEPMQSEFSIPRPDGTVVHVVSASRTLGMEPPLKNYRVTTVIDVTKQKNSERDLREQYQHLSQLSDTVFDQALQLKRYSQTLEERVEGRTRELNEAHMESVYMLAVASEAKDQDTGQHVRRIQQYARMLALKIGIPLNQAHEIGYSSVLHDVGKIHIPDRILQKPGPLTTEERIAMQEHTTAGEHIISESPFFARARKIARSHHENWDGSGYPDHLVESEIPVEARIVHLADVYDALTSARVYKGPWEPADAAKMIRDGSARMFDPELVKAFDELFNHGDFLIPSNRD